MTETTEYALEKADNHICEECLRKTKIGYDDKGGFFTPHFRSINHVEVGYSKIISNPLTILIERLYVIYDKTKDWLAGIGPWLFPRRDKIYGKTMDSSLVGKITFAKKKDIEVPNIREITRTFKQGEIAVVVIEEEVYKWAMVIENKKDGIVEIITREKPDDSDFITSVCVDNN